MCMTSYIGDDWTKNFPVQYPNWPVPTGAGNPLYNPLGVVTRAEFDAMKVELEELKKVLAAAKKYDEATGQKNCEMDAKIAFIKQVADFVGVDLKEVFD